MAAEARLEIVQTIEFATAPEDDDCDPFTNFQEDEE